LDQHAYYERQANKLSMELKNGAYKIFERDRLQMLKIGKYGGEQHCSFALNEFYLTTSEFLRTFRYD
jgi:hypothetical protein